jgi:hypothetical protein
VYSARVAEGGQQFTGLENRDCLPGPNEIGAARLTRLSVVTKP